MDTIGHLLCEVRGAGEFALALAVLAVLSGVALLRRAAALETRELQDGVSSDGEFSWD